MANNTLEVSLALKTAGFRSEVNAVKKDNQVLKAEFDKLASSVDKFEDTLEGKQARLKLVSKEYENAQKLVDIYKKQVEEAGKAVESANKKFNDQQERLNAAKAYVEKYKDATGDTAKVVAETEARIEELEKELNKQAKAVSSANTHYQNMQIQLANAETSVNELGNELKTCATDVYRFDGKLQGLENQLREVESELDEVGQSAVDFGAKMSVIGQGLIDVGNNITELGKKGLSAMRNLVSKGAEWNASVAGQEFVYNTLDQAIQKVIDTKAKESKAIGLTEQQYKNNATNMASYYKNMGLTTEQTESLVGETMNLVADLAAVNDIPFDDALSRFKSGLMGNYEALDAFNINLSASSLGNSEYVKSLGKSWNSLSDNEKMMAAYNEIVRQGEFATGLAGQEAESFTMQMNLLKEQISEAAGKIGESLLPTLEPLIQMLSDIVDKVVGWVENNPQLTATLLAVVGVISALFITIGPLFSLLGNVAIVFGSLSTSAAGAGTTVLGIIGTSLLPLITAIGAIVAIVVVVAMAIKENWDEIKEATNHLIEKCRPYFEQLGEAFSSLWETCQSIYQTIIQPLFKLIGEIIAICIELSAPLFNLLAGIFTRMINAFVTSWNTWGKPLFDTIMFIIQTLFRFIKPIFLLIAEIFSGVVDSMFSCYDNILAPMFGAFMDVVGAVIETVRPTFKDIKECITGALETVNDAIDSTIGWFRDLFGWINDSLGKVGDFLSSLNPFKSRSIELDASLNTRSIDLPDIKTLSTNVGVTPLNDIALSGSYYTPQTALSSQLNRISTQASTIPSTVRGIDLNYDSIEKMLDSKLSQMIQAISQITIKSPDVYLDTEKVSNELDRFGGRSMKLYGRFK